METSRPKPLYVMIPNDLNDPLQISIGHRVIGMTIVDRSAVHRLTADWNVPGIYLLLDRPDPTGRWAAYVGKASPGGLRTRVLNHASTRDNAWYRALLVRRNDDKLHSGQAGWLEGELYNHLLASDQVYLHNRNRPQDDTISLEDQISLGEYVPPILHTLHLLGHRLIPAPPSATAQEQRTIRWRIRARQTSSRTEAQVPTEAPNQTHPKPRSRVGARARSDICVYDLLEEGLVASGTKLVSPSRMYPGFVTIADDGWLEDHAGRRCETLSGAAKALIESHSDDEEKGKGKRQWRNGWDFWLVPTPGGLAKIDTLRRELERRRAMRLEQRRDSRG
ncbi:hypothetical protein ABZ912_47945 [Nonomuraea angiospora]|uniref:hypothetical protein n=1 Tax=Nonomuraea angiospora TaxID=46172 RepID=UPI0033FFFFBE